MLKSGDRTREVSIQCIGQMRGTTHKLANKHSKRDHQMMNRTNMGWHSHSMSRDRGRSAGSEQDK